MKINKIVVDKLFGVFKHEIPSLDVELHLNRSAAIALP